MKLSIIIPAYNEEKRIENTLEEYSKYFDEIARREGLDYEILVVINNTKDGTEEIVRKIQKKFTKIKYLNLVKGGKGYAVLEGFKDALKRKNELIGFVDADMSTTPDAFYDLVSNINSCGGVIASRYIKGSMVKPKPSFARVLVSRIFNASIRAILFMPYRDTQCGAKLFKREVLMMAIPHIKMTRWAFDVELIYTIRKDGFIVKEIPTKWSDKAYSTINFMTAGPWMALAIVRLRILHSPLKRFIRVYDQGVKLFR